MNDKMYELCVFLVEECNNCLALHKSINLSGVAPEGASKELLGRAHAYGRVIKKIQDLFLIDVEEANKFRETFTRRT